MQSATALKMLKVLYVSERNELPPKLMPFSANAEFRIATSLSSTVAALAAAEYDYILVDRYVPEQWKEKLALLASPRTRVERM